MLKAILQGRFLKHPLHPIFAHFPIGLWTASFIFDVIYFITKNAHFAISSYDCMAVGIIGSLLAAPTGLAEYQDIPLNTLPRKLANLHLALNLVITVLYIFNLVSRSANHTALPIISPTQFILSIVGIILLGISGYLGGRLVYSYGIGYRTHTENAQPADTKKAA